MLGGKKKRGERFYGNKFYFFRPRVVIFWRTYVYYKGLLQVRWFRQRRCTQSPKGRQQQQSSVRDIKDDRGKQKTC